MKHTSHTLAATEREMTLISGIIQKPSLSPISSSSTQFIVLYVGQESASTVKRYDDGEPEFN